MPAIALLLYALLELYGLVSFGGAFGGWALLGFLTASCLAGLWVLLRSRRTLALLARNFHGAHPGEAPAAGGLSELVFGSIAGLLLLAPGFISTALGLILLVRPARNLLGAWCGKYLTEKSGLIRVTRWVSFAPRPGGPWAASGAVTFDVESGSSGADAASRPAPVTADDAPEAEPPCERTGGGRRAREMPVIDVTIK